MGVSNITRTVDAVQSGTWNVNAIASTGFPVLATDGSAAGTAGIHVLGTDGTNAQILSTNATGHVNIADGGNSITVDGSVSITGTVTVDSEMSTAAALTDNFANPTVGGVGGFSMVWDGATWDRMAGNSSGGTFVQGPVAHDGVLAGNPLVLGGYAKTTVPTSVTADGDVVNAWFDRGGRMAVWDGDLTVSIDDGGGSITVDGVTGSIAHDGVWSGSPLLIGGYASTATPTAVSTDGDVVHPWYDLNGRAAIWDGNTTISIDDGAGTITVDGTVAISGSVAVTGTFGIATAGSAHITTGPQLMVSDGTNAVRLKGTSTGSAYVTGEAIAALTTQASISVSTTRTTLIASNANRKGFIVVNQGTAAIYVGNGSVVDGSGAAANGGTYVSGYGGSIDGTQMCGYTGIISAVAASGTQIITVMEW